MTHMLTHDETECQRSVNNIWSCILGHQGSLRMNVLRTEPLTASMAKYAMYRSRNMYSKIINVADRKTSKKKLLAVEYLILIIYHYPTVKTRSVYKSTDQPALRPADNPPNSEGLNKLNRTVAEMTVRVD